MNNECLTAKKCAEGAFLDGGTNRFLWATVEQNAVNGRQGVCYAFPPSVAISYARTPCFVIDGNIIGGCLESSNASNQRKARHPKPDRWWEFWK